MSDRGEAMEQHAVRNAASVYRSAHVEATPDEVPPGYKRTDVGIIPEDWEVKRLGELYEIKSSKRVLQRDWRKYGIPFFRTREIAVLAEKGKVENELFISETIYKEYSKKYGVPSIGDVLITGIGTIGKVYVVQDDRRFYFKDASVLWLKSRGLFDSVFLKNLFETPLLEAQLGNSSTGTTVETYTISGAKSTVVVAPKIKEQRAIANALSDADALIESLDRLIAKKRATKQAAMQQLLTGQVRLPGFTGEWETKRFAEVLERKNAKAHQIQTSDYRKSGKYPVVDQGQQSIIGFTDRDDKVFSCTDAGIIVFGDHTCIVKFVNFDFAVGADGTQVLSAKAGHSTRFYAYELEYRGVQPTGYNRHFKFLKEREFFVPGHEEQTVIATLLSDMDTEIETLECRRDKAGEIKQGMMQQLLTGRVRLV